MKADIVKAVEMYESVTPEMIEKRDREVEKEGEGGEESEEKLPEKMNEEEYIEHQREKDRKYAEKLKNMNKHAQEEQIVWDSNNLTRTANAIVFHSVARKLYLITAIDKLIDTHGWVWFNGIMKNRNGNAMKTLDSKDLQMFRDTLVKLRKNERLYLQMGIDLSHQITVYRKALETGKVSWETYRSMAMDYAFME